jgi:hypothetical protein
MGDEEKALERLMLLATSSRDRLESVSDDNRSLSRLESAQGLILTMLSESLPDTESLQKNLNDADKEILSLNSQLSDVENELFVALGANSPARTNPTDILQGFLVNFQSVLLDLSKASAEKGQPAVPFVAIIELENQIAKTIDELFDRGLYQESDTETAVRLQRREAHAQKLVDFLAILRGRAAEPPQPPA